MKQWGREGYAGDWPSDKAVWTIAAFFVALLSVASSARGLCHNDGLGVTNRHNNMRLSESRSGT